MSTIYFADNKELINKIYNKLLVDIKYGLKYGSITHIFDVRYPQNKKYISNEGAILDFIYKLIISNSVAYNNDYNKIIDIPFKNPLQMKKYYNLRTEFINISNISFYKLLRGLNYNIEDKPKDKRITSLIISYAHEIISQMPEYETSPWVF